MIDTSYRSLESMSIGAWKNLKKIHYKVGGGSRAYSLYPIPAGFDIETTNDDKSRTAYMYHWQLTFGDDLYVGRTWDSFFGCLHNLTGIFNKAKIMIFIHNMAFEMSFLLPQLYARGLLDKVFAKAKNTPLEVRTKNGIIFRDSMALTNMSLADLAKKYTTTQKLIGDLDYSKPRNSKTPLTPEELEYCKNDVIILREYAELLHKEYTVNGRMIPMTSTGVVRSFVKRQIKPSRMRFVRQEISRLWPQDPERYWFTMHYVFRGGFTHAQTAACDVDYNIDQIGPDDYTHKKSTVESYDLTSAYPSMIVSKLYPMTPFIEYDPKLFDDMIKDEMNAIIITVTFYNIKATGYHVIESKNKIIDYAPNSIFENGRLAESDRITVALTDVDYNIYKKFYTWDTDKSVIHTMIVARKRELPRYITESIFYFYSEKKRLKKEVADLEAAGATPDDPDLIRLQGYYQNSKANLNSNYGMMVAGLNLSEWDFDGHDYYEKPILKRDGSEKTYQDIIREQILSPYWGIYVTAYCRATILNAIDACKEKAIYSDTDSVKCLPGCEEIFNDFNKVINKQNKGLCERYQLDFNVYGDIGLFDHECTYTRFKTFGAKRYIFIKNGKFTATIAGLPKKTAIDKYKEIGADQFFEFFSPDMEFEVSGKNAHHPTGECYAVIDGEEMHELGCMYIYPVSFKMTVKDSFLQAIHIRKDQLYNAPEAGE